jgi:hypothetical protein
MTPVKSREMMGESDFRDMARTMRTAATAKANAEIWGGNAAPRKTRDNEAPKAAPDEIPRMNSLTSGFLNRAWSAAPDTESEEPTIIARMSRGSRTLKTVLM